MVQTAKGISAAGAAAELVLADAAPVSPTAASPAAAAAIAVIRPSACLIFTVVLVSLYGWPLDSRR
jgi:hypothetical protein